MGFLFSACNSDDIGQSILPFLQTKLPKALGVHKKRIHEGVKDEVCHICGTAVFNKYMLQGNLLSGMYWQLFG